tara:strand:- start:322 stop:510 length:189 start_codon:yes stop_codon:yes gene_type:complete
MKDPVDFFFASCSLVRRCLIASCFSLIYLMYLRSFISGKPAAAINPKILKRTPPTTPATAAK